MVFWARISVNTAAVSSKELIIESVDKFEPCVGIFMDTSQAFERNTGNSFVLLEKKAGSWQINKGLDLTYRFERYQFVEINRSQNNRIIKEQSNLELQRYGVPQKSLGPLLFYLLCYIKNIAQRIIC